MFHDLCLTLLLFSTLCANAYNIVLYTGNVLRLTLYLDALSHSAFPRNHLTETEVEVVVDPIGYKSSQSS